MSLLSKKTVLCSIFLCLTAVPLLAIAGSPNKPSYPTVPPAYEVLRPSKLTSAARVDFPAYTIKRTNGYKVTAPNGTEFVVDNIVQPKCAFYATYVSTNDSGYLSLSSNVQVKSNVYIGEVNFDKCQ
jgi:hypothetical protein